MKTLPVTVLSGLPGSGKSTVINHLLQNCGSMKLGVIMNELHETSDEHSRVQILRPSALSGPVELSRLTDGCICCSLREELLAEVWQIADDAHCDALLIESASTAELLSIAESFLYVDERGESISGRATLDTLVCVINAATFLTDYQSVDELRDLGIGLGEDDDRDLVRLLVDQLEFANVILLNKTDLVPQKDVSLMMTILSHLNPEARVIATSHGAVAPNEVLKTGRFLLSQSGDSIAVPSALESANEFGISSFTYQSRRPFHPQRFFDFWMSEEIAPQVLRSRGYLWLATRHTTAGLWSQTGQVLSADPAGPWWAETPREEWPQDDPELQTELDAVWDETWGDRRQELMIVAQHLDEAEFTRALDECLLTDRELQAGLEAWQSMPDPFHSWEACGLDHEHGPDCNHDHS